MFNNQFNHHVVFGPNVTSRLTLGALFAVLCVLPACSINVDKDKNNEGSKHVDIKSPMGDLHVSEQVDIRDAGLSVYPGAKPAVKDSTPSTNIARCSLVRSAQSKLPIAGISSERVVCRSRLPLDNIPKLTRAH